MNEEAKMTFKEVFKKLKNLADGKYFSIAYEVTSYTSNRLVQECRLYIDGVEWVSGPTWEIAIGLLQESLEISVLEENINHIPQI